MEPADPPLDTAKVLAHLRWLAPLARHLAGGATGSEDLVQETWLACLSRPPRDPDATGSWLRRVLRNSALRSRRTESRRRAREEIAARPEAQPSDPGELVERAELIQRVSQLVLRLDEPYRSTVLLRYMENLAAPEIAQRQGVPVSTVYTRLRRALDELRERVAARGASRVPGVQAAERWIAALRATRQVPGYEGKVALWLVKDLFDNLMTARDLVLIVEGVVMQPSLFFENPLVAALLTRGESSRLAALREIPALAEAAHRVVRFAAGRRSLNPARSYATLRLGIAAKERTVAVESLIEASLSRLRKPDADYVLGISGASARYRGLAGPTSEDRTSALCLDTVERLSSGYYRDRDLRWVAGLRSLFTRNRFWPRLKLAWQPSYDDTLQEFNRR